WASVKLSGSTIIPPFGSRACAATTDSSSKLSRTGAAIASTAKAAAAAWKGFSQYSAKFAAAVGLKSIAKPGPRNADATRPLRRRERTSVPHHRRSRKCHFRTSRLGIGVDRRILGAEAFPSARQRESFERGERARSDRAGSL